MTAQVVKTSVYTTFSIRLHSSDIERLQEIASSKGIPPSVYVRVLIKDELKRNKCNNFKTLDEWVSFTYEQSEEHFKNTHEILKEAFDSGIISKVDRKSAMMLSDAAFRLGLKKARKDGVRGARGYKLKNKSII